MLKYFDRFGQQSRQKMEPFKRTLLTYGHVDTGPDRNHAFRATESHLTSLASVYMEPYCMKTVQYGSGFCANRRPVRSNFWTYSGNLYLSGPKTGLLGHSKPAPYENSNFLINCCKYLSFIKPAFTAVYF